MSPASAIRLTVNPTVRCASYHRSTQLRLVPPGADTNAKLIALGGELEAVRAAHLSTGTQADRHIMIYVVQEPPRPGDLVWRPDDLESSFRWPSLRDDAGGPIWTHAADIDRLRTFAGYGYVITADRNRACRRAWEIVEACNTWVGAGERLYSKLGCEAADVRANALQDNRITVKYRIAETPTRTLAGLIGKARAVELCEYDVDEEMVADMARDLPQAAALVRDLLAMEAGGLSRTAGVPTSDILLG